MEWISVKDRLPEDSKDALTCDRLGNIHIMEHHHLAKVPFNISSDDYNYFPITHWQPLPAPPKED